MTANERSTESDGSETGLPEATQSEVDAAIEAIERDERILIGS